MSLGIDLSPDIKQCNFDCLYCELNGAKTMQNQIVTISVDEIIIQLKKALAKHTNIDVITITANGEPTIYPHLDNLISEIDKIKKNIKTLILSNAGNIYEPKIQNTLLKIDIVKLSLDCISDKCFNKLDRLHQSIKSDKIVSGIQNFSEIYDKDLIIETLFIKNINDNEKELQLLKKAYEKLDAIRIDICTIDRPPAYQVEALEYHELQKIKNFLDNDKVNIVYKNRPKSISSYTSDEIINLLNKRPLTIEDIDNTFDEKSKIILQQLIVNHKVCEVSQSNNTFFKVI